MGFSPLSSIQKNFRGVLLSTLKRLQGLWGLTFHGVLQYNGVLLSRLYSMRNHMYRRDRKHPSECLHSPIWITFISRTKSDYYQSKDIVCVSVNIELLQIILWIGQSDIPYISQAWIDNMYMYILSRTSEAGSPTNRLGSGQRQDTDQGPFSPKHKAYVKPDNT